MKYTSYLFDFDGTLVNSMPAFVSVMQKVLDENNIAYGKDIINIITPLGYMGTAEYFKKLGMKLSTEKILERIYEYAYNEYAHNIPAKANVVQTLRKLKENGADLNVLTASPNPLVDVCLKRLEIYDLFTNVWSCDNFGTTKGNPDIYVSAAQKMGKPIGEILFLDDNYNAGMAAKRSGIKVCGVYDPSSKDCADKIKENSDYYIRDFSQLLEL